MTSVLRTVKALVAVTAIALATIVLLAVPGSAQDVACPAGGRGGEGGDAGRSVGGNGGLAFTVPGFGTTGDASAAGGTGGSARGGTGARGGSGTLPVCNQNTNGGGGGGARAASAPAAAAAAPAARAGSGGPGYGVGGGLARTGATTNAEIGLAGLALAIGGALLFAGQPRWAARRN